MNTLLEKEIPPPFLLSVDGSPYEMGYTHGKKLKQLILNLLEKGEKRIEETGITLDTLSNVLNMNIDHITKISPELIEELKGMSEGTQISLEKLFIAHFYHEILCAQPTEFSITNNCTSFAATGKATTNNNTLLSMNTDSSFESMYYRIILKACPKGGFKYISHSRAADNGGYGINEKGVAIVAPTVLCNDSIYAFSKHKPSGLYDRAISRLVLGNCKNLDEALEYIRKMPGGYQGLNILIMDGSGTLAKIERSYNKINIIKSSPKTNLTLAATNHFTSKEMEKICSSNKSKRDNSKKRYNRISELLSSNYGKLNVDDFKEFSRDHCNRPDSICRHEGDIITNCSLIAQSKPDIKRVWISWGTPCKNKFITFKIK